MWLNHTCILLSLAELLSHTAISSWSVDRGQDMQHYWRSSIPQTAHAFFSIFYRFYEVCNQFKYLWKLTYKMLNSTIWQWHNCNLFTLSFTGQFFQRKGKDWTEMSPSSLIPKLYQIIRSQCLWCYWRRLCILHCHCPACNQHRYHIHAHTNTNELYLPRLAAFSQLYFEALGFTFFSKLSFL